MKHYHVRKLVILFVFLSIASLSQVYSQNYFSFQDRNVVVKRGSFTIYYQNKTHELPLKLSDGLYLLFRYSMHEGIYAISIISDKKVGEKALFTMRLLNSELYKDISPLQIEQSITLPVLSEDITKEFGRGYDNKVKFAPFVLNDVVYYAYVISLPNITSPLIYAESGVVSFTVDGVKQEHTLSPEMIRILQDFGLIMRMLGLR